jgi:predicted dinucleotide-binding enzyme
MKVGILGTGDVGRTLGLGLIGLGHEAKMGSRSAANPKVEEFVAAGGARASGGDFREAAAFGELIVLAALGTAVPAVLESAGPQNVRGKVVIDATNPLDFGRGFPISLSIGHSDSLGEVVQRTLPEARVVKAFNTVGAVSMVRPEYAEGPPDMFICGDDAPAKAMVGDICREFGWNPVDLGPIQASRCLEPMALAWVLHGLGVKSWTHAFKFLRR